MTTISIIGSGNMATAIGARAAAHGHTVEILGRDSVQARAAADDIGHGATVAEYGTKPTGDIVFLAVLYASAVDIVTHYGDKLAGKIIIEITNPFNADASGVVTTPGNSITQQIAAVAPADTQVVKAFNTIFRDVLASDRKLDVFFAGGNAKARVRVSALLESMGLRPLDAGGLETTHALEWAGILLMGLARNGGGFGITLGAE
ncbi:NADPH-dependent F420 reductase [Subtercola lobariae]|uniref:NADP oxidoreductase n=1 Tax=Subtercola lobariae TaxID=1588641 RepID=A0A917B7G7_9MICO|nr:NAD(P)-binding domain-containing protein [Subtercola lobariae]GGF27941.1 NADP oxidoreductase [Subtercola lobariae]